MNYHAARWHDFKRPSIYHITLTQLPGQLPFGHLAGSDDYPYIQTTPFGNAVRLILQAHLNRDGAFFMGTHIIMPDHIHLLLTVQQPLARSIRCEVAAAKSAVSRLHARLRGMDTVPSVFVSDFHTRILFNADQLDTASQYIKDNPRRLWVKRSHPDLFTARHTLTVHDRQWDAMGNIFLLNDFDIQSARVSSRISDAERAQRRQAWQRVIDNSGVFAGYFFSEPERQLRQMLIDNGGRLIMLMDHPMPERYKPAGRWFDMCAGARLLILAPAAPLPGHWSQRRICLYLNDVGDAIAAHNFSDQTL